MRFPNISLNVLLAASILLGIQAGSLHAQQRQGVRPNVNPPSDCYVAEPVEAENIYDFLKAQIQALSLAKKGEGAVVGILGSNGMAPVGDKTVIGLREDRVANACASFIVSSYSNSNVPDMATIAKFLAYAYDELGNMDNQMFGITLQKSLRKINGPSPQRQFSELMDKRRALLRDMSEALNLSLDLLVDAGRKAEEGKPDHLILMKADIKALLEYLYSRFPALKDGNQVEKPGDFTKQAALVREFLTSGYKPADSP